MGKYKAFEQLIETMNLSIKAGKKIYDRLVALCEGSVTPEKISSFSLEEIKSIGTSQSKASYIQLISSSIINKELELEKLSEMDDSEVIKALTKVKGIGMWTAKMYLIFVLDRQDILPFEDVAFRQSYKWLYKARKMDNKTIERKCKIWKPYSSIAARYLYLALDNGLTKEE